VERDSAGVPARYRPIALLVGLCCLLAGALAPGSSSADAGWVSFLNSEHKVDFGHEIEFSLDAQATRAIGEVSILYWLAEEAARNRAPAAFEGGREFRATHKWQLERGELAPGEGVCYRWAVRSAEGEEAESPETCFTYEDERFRWESVRQGRIEVFHYGARPLAERLAAAGAKAIARVEEATGLRLAAPVRVYLYASPRDMALAIPVRSELFDAATVTLGMLVDEDAIVLLADQEAPERTLAHELSHALLAQAVSSPFAEIPRWLDEGLAMYAEGDLPEANRRALERAARSGQVLGLRSLTSCPGKAELVDLFYAEAYSVVSYLIQEEGPARVHELLALLARGLPVEEAVQKALGLSLAEVEQRWLATLGVAAREDETPAVTPPGSVAPEGEKTRPVRGLPVCSGAFLVLGSLGLLLTRLQLR